MQIHQIIEDDHMPDEQEIHPEVRLIELRSREIHELDDNNTWKEVSRDSLVSEQFNKWAQDNDINPVGVPSITMHQTYQQIDDQRSRVITTYTLCAAVMTRNNQWLSEMSYRMQVAKAINTVVTSPPVVNSPIVNEQTKSIETTSVPPGGKLDVTQVSMTIAPPPPSPGNT